MITSLSNPKVKAARKLSLRKTRQAEHQFLVEGVRAIEEAVRAGMPPALVFVDPAVAAADSRLRELLSLLAQQTNRIEEVTPDLLRAMAQTESPQGIVAVYPFPDLPVPEPVALALVLDAIRDPGNIGTILRTAWAAGVDLVLIGPGSADPYNPKVVRSAMGAHFSLPIRSASWHHIAAALAPIPRVYLADAHGELPYFSADWSAPRALIIGGEAEGASQAARDLATARISIPMPGRAESLNVAIAAGILLFQAVADQGL